jgi:ATP-dependent DNA helicase RecQ
LRQVVELVEAPGCQVAMLCAHFGETREKPCGHCTRCLGAEARSVARSAPAIDKKTWAEAMSVRRANPATLKDPMAAARWLCGVASPSLTRAKLSAHPLFGSLADCTLAQVRDRLAAEFV